MARLTSKEASQWRCLYQRTLERSPGPVWKAPRKRIRCGEVNFPFRTQVHPSPAAAQLAEAHSPQSHLSKQWPRLWAQDIPLLLPLPCFLPELARLPAARLVQRCACAPARLHFQLWPILTPRPNLITHLVATGRVLALWFNSTGRHNVFTMN